MATAKVRVNMIIDGHFHKFGSQMDENSILPKYRKRKFIVRAGEIDPDAEEMKQQEKAAETMLQRNKERNLRDTGVSSNRT